MDHIFSFKKNYLTVVRAYWWIYVLGFFFLTLTTLTEIATPKFIQWSLDLLSKKEIELPNIPLLFRGENVSETLTQLSHGFLFLLLIGLMGRIGWRQCLARRTHSEGKNLRLKFWNSIAKNNLNFFHQYTVGDLMNRATGDINSARFIFGFTLVGTYDAIFVTLFCMISMYVIDPRLATLILFSFLFIPRKILSLAKKEEVFHDEAQKSLSSLSDTIAQALATVRLQKATASYEIWTEKLSEQAEDYAQKKFKVSETAIKIFPWAALPTLTAYGILLSFGIYFIFDGSLSIGKLVALLSYVLLMQGPLNDLGDYVGEWQRGIASLKRLYSLGLKTEIKNENVSLLPLINQTESPLLLKDIIFSYQEKIPEQAVLKSIQLKLNPGDKIGIYGEIGSGKSSLLRLISKEIIPMSGEIKLYGASYQNVSQEFISQKITHVMQIPFIFSGSIRHNLELNQSYSDEKIWYILKLVCLDQDIEKMENGLESKLGERGVNLSGGQKQRLCLARALLRDAPILLLDDCLCAVDSIIEEKIIFNLNELLKSKTMIWVAHRKSTLKNCHRIYEMIEGYLLAK